MRHYIDIIEGLTQTGDTPPTHYTREGLELVDIDDLDRMAFGHVGDEIIELDPSEITLKWNDIENAEYKFARGGMDWARSVSFDEPVNVSITRPGVIELEDGHHRYFAAKKLDRKLKAEVEIKGNPINVILDRQRTNPE